MNPTVGEQLGAIRQRLAETVLPALREDADLAREQGAFVLVALDVIAAAHEHEYRYEVVELHDTASTIGELMSCAPNSAVRSDLEAEASRLESLGRPRLDEAAMPLATVRGIGRIYKEVAAQLFETLCDTDAPTRDAARAVMLRLAAQQVERERALFAATGYTTSERSLLEVLDFSTRKDLT
jgi:hypothetical protein